MTPRDQIAALLSAFYADHQANLHDAANRPTLDDYAGQILALMTPAPMPVLHLYATRSRPAMYGTVPTGFKVESEEQTDLAPFGTISYEAPRSALTCWKYELRNLFDDYKVGDLVEWFENGEVCTGKIFQIDNKWEIWANEYTKLPFWALHLASPAPAPDLLTRIMTASPQYVTRFHGHITREGALLAMERELKEVYEAVEDLLRTPDDPALLKAFAGEMSDVMVTMGGLAHAMHVPPEMITEQAHATLTKLDARTEADYVWHEDTKTVIARAKLEAGS